MAGLALLGIYAAIDIGITNSGNSPFYVRFVSLAGFSIALFALVSSRRVPHLNALSIVFICAFLVGLTFGPIEHGLSRVTFAHSYYVVMPVVMMAFGHSFFQTLLRHDDLLRQMMRGAWVLLALSAAAVGIFATGHFLGLHRYPAVGLSGLLHGGSLVAFQPGGGWLYSLAVLLSFAGRKRVGIAIILVAGLAVLAIKFRKRLLVAPLALVPFGILFWSAAMLVDFGGLRRWEFTVTQFLAGDLDAATAGRVSETISAMDYILSEPIRLLIGAGFGATFIPWESDDLIAHVQHYTHFSPAAYVFVGGIFLALFVYGWLCYLCFKMLSLSLQGRIDPRFLGFTPLLCGVVISSLSGPVVLNDSILWFVVGCSHAICRHFGKAANMSRRIAANSQPA